MQEKFPWIKYIIGIVLFAFFHQLYDIFPNTLTIILAEGPQESIFAHMKMLFYPYLIISVVEYFLKHRDGQIPTSYWYARMAILVSAPWMMISVFYVPQAFGILFEGTMFLLYSILISWLGVYIAIRLEKPLETIEYRPALKSLILFLFISAIIIYTGFSFRLPYNLFFDM